ncbi:ASCH domain-containing protein [Trinickia dinghuensis]|uniref:ASCH domain-containing protein n=1 Tax=Trinickia dinghuensis TaxID=2291023 RepID=A0A3D8K3J9_9BURK|nr:ASCH domain-containing protein [Trinickia dinghuensis]RDU99171.1 hypothetical protein DWV00_08575 [Trinickia dinghuensis]
MKALSIRQPWAWLIVRPDLAGAARAAAIAAGELKDIENRTWPTRFHGRVLIHAGKGMTRDEYDEAHATALHIAPQIVFPARDRLERGGIVGAATIDDCMPPGAHSSPWHMGSQFGFHIVNARPLPFVECKGMLGFFNVPAEVATQLRQMHELGAIA